MNVYKVSQTINNNYDTYDSCIVFAETESDARNNNLEWNDEDVCYGQAWVAESQKHLLNVEWLGELVEGEAGVILSSFNAG